MKSSKTGLGEVVCFLSRDPNRANRRERCGLPGTGSGAGGCGTRRALPALTVRLPRDGSVRDVPYEGAVVARSKLSEVPEIAFNT